MADEAKAGSAANSASADEGSKQTVDEIKNLKAEFDRKLGNLEKSNQALLSQLQAIANKGPAPKKEPEPKKEIYKDVWYDDPEKAGATVEERAAQKALAEIQRQNAEQAKRNNVIGQLYREYPELQDFENPLTVKAVELFDKLSEEEKAHPMAYRLAVKEAADELDIKPKAKRKKDDNDNFSLSSDGNSSDGKGKGTRTRKGELDPRTVEFAKLVGLNTEDPKVLDSLKKRNERQVWTRWE